MSLDRVYEQHTETQEVHKDKQEACEYLCSHAYVWG